MAITSLQDFRDAGIEPLARKIVVLKLGYLMPELRDAAPREMLVLTPGYSDMQLERLPFRYVTRPIFPLDGDFAWQPPDRECGGQQHGSKQLAVSSLQIRD